MSTKKATPLSRDLDDVLRLFVSCNLSLSLGASSAAKFSSVGSTD